MSDSPAPSVAAAKTEVSGAMPAPAPLAGPAASAAPAAPPPAKRPGGRRALLALVALAALGAAGWYGTQWWRHGRFVVSTDDAYVQADTAIISAKVSGYVSDVLVTDNQRVKAGEALLKIDDGDYRLAVQAAADKVATQDATIARMGAQIEAQGAAIAQAQAQQTSAEAAKTLADAAFTRVQNLARHDVASQAQFDSAQADRARAAASVDAAKAALESSRRAVDVLKAQKTEAERARAELETAKEKAERDLSFTAIVAPFEGVVGNKAAQPGQFVQPAQRLMALVPLDTVYIAANFKETQIARLRPGQRVEIEVDAYDRRPIEGTVVSVAPASGAQFSLLPPDNATGNFTKIVQRVPVRIAVPADVAARGALRPGLSVTASVDTSGLPDAHAADALTGPVPDKGGWFAWLTGPASAGSSQNK